MQRPETLLPGRTGGREYGRAGKRPWRKKKAFVTLAAVLALTLSVSIVSVAATDGKIVEEVKDKVSVWFRNLTLDEEASTQDHMVLRAEDGTYIAIDQDERNPKLVYHEDSKSLGLAIGGREIDITEDWWKTAYIRRNIPMKARRTALRSREN